MSPNFLCKVVKIFFVQTCYLLRIVGQPLSLVLLRSIRARTAIVAAVLRNWNVRLDIYIQSKSYINLSFTYH